MVTSPTLHLVRSVLAVWRLRGFDGVLAVARSKIYWRAHYVRFAVDLREWTIVEHHGPGVEAREGTLEELIRFRENRPDLPAQFFCDLTHGARRFYLGFADGVLGHISWVYGEGDHVRHMRLGRGEIMLEGALTFKSCRGRGLLSAVERAALNDAKREGLRAAYTHVSTDNRASLKGVWKTGFRPVGLLTWRWILGVPLMRYVHGPTRAAAAAGLERSELQTATASA